MRPTMRLAAVFLLFSLALVAAACGGDRRTRCKEDSDCASDHYCFIVRGDAEGSCTFGSRSDGGPGDGGVVDSDGGLLDGGLVDLDGGPLDGGVVDGGLDGG